ncbi:MAG: cytochrome c [Gammaproteobacteria bacterium]|nr:c-type cytochrome [Gammaproteobacteria bacterium]NIN60923.1 c-type cytochrome [Gammaproteobacteria bacterium]NIO62547.1 c-type cytochrome [Gammaproteobacteria bacterium]NIP49536.1 cytochrome c [Gammaproteobacteria bacterium]NIQ10760.1 cytochrome c [Gammaproteobacteria bacterium]
MKSPKALILLILMLAGTSLRSYCETLLNGPMLGEPASSEEIAAWDISVMPGGDGLPGGKGSVAQGRRIYEKQCISCHGPRGQGGNADQLAGAGMGLTSEYPEKTIGSYWPYATTLFDMIRRSMPMTAPGTLSDDEVYAVTAYLLYLNGIIEEDTLLDAEVLSAIKMPNRDGFINVYEETGGN